MIDSRIDKIIDNALREDIGNQDITTHILIPKDEVSQAFMVTRQEAVLCGLEIAKRVFHKLDKMAKFRSSYKDGDKVSANTKILFITAKTRALLTGERVALNFLTYLSGIATTTSFFLKKIHPSKVKIMDTRKTTPCLRNLEKYAVKCGGGINHRFTLSEMVLIKDNHRSAYQSRMSLREMIKRAKKVSNKPVEVEVNNLIQLKQALSAHPDIILLDNMPLKQIKKAVTLIRKMKKRPLLEVSGRVNLENVRAIAKTGIDRISIGALTHTRKAIDISLEVIS